MMLKEDLWSPPLRPVFSYLAVNQQKDNLLPSKHLALKTAQFHLFLKRVTVLDPSSHPPSRHSWLYAGVGGWENQTLQIA